VSALERAATALDTLAEWTGRAISWLTLTLALTGFVVVVLRYAFSSGFLWMQESLTWMHAIVFMIGAGYTLKHDEQVRVDVVYRGLSERARAIVDLAGTVLFLVPFCAYVVYESLPYVLSSWHVGERSREAGGLPALYLLKTVIPLMALLLAIQGLAVAMRCVALLRKGR
jgi:TRAP-type mannitol/chloroaromatic compound transport system permease small subunit